VSDKAGIGLLKELIEEPPCRFGDTGDSTWGASGPRTGPSPSVIYFCLLHPARVGGSLGAYRVKMCLNLGHCMRFCMSYEQQLLLNTPFVA
jgi:hypothetical protein